MITTSSLLILMLVEAVLIGFSAVMLKWYSEKESFNEMEDMIEF